MLVRFQSVNHGDCYVQVICCMTTSKSAFKYVCPVWAICFFETKMGICIGSNLYNVTSSLWADQRDCLLIFYSKKQDYSLLVDCRHASCLHESNTCSLLSLCTCSFDFFSVWKKYLVKVSSSMQDTLVYLNYPNNFYKSCLFWNVHHLASLNTDNSTKEANLPPQHHPHSHTILVSGVAMQFPRCPETPLAS